jgi:TPR repeat protein/uncharacterized membrane protein YbaN (DUF454 family)
MLRIILVAIAAAVFIVLFRRNKTRSLRTFTAYYAQKRRDFPWLENWVKENGDPVPKRLKDDSGTSISVAIVFFVVVVIVMLIFPKWIPLHIILLALTILVTEYNARGKTKNPGSLSGDKSGDDIGSEGDEWGLTLECPSCHCPHSWVMPQKEVIVDGDSGSKTTTTQRTTISGGDLGDVGAEAARRIMGDNYGDGTKVTETHNYYGREFKDFMCLNCGHHTERNEFSREWGSSCPDAGMRYFDPPKTAWGYKATMEKHDAAANDLYEQAKREEAQKVSATAPSTQGSQAANDNTGISPTLLKAAEMGNEDAKADVGIAYLLGLGVEQNEETAKMWLEDYIEYDSIDFYRLAKQADSSTSEGNYPLAIQLYEKAVAKNDGRSDLSCWCIGNIYAATYTGMYDKEKARHWYQKAIDMGYKDAKKQLKELK